MTFARTKVYSSLIALLVLNIAVPVHAQSPVARTQLEKMFANIAKQTRWDMSREMLWGYFFTNPTQAPLEAAAAELSKMGYRIVLVYPSDKKQPTDPDLWWLHVERVEVHSVESLHQRNIELTQFAARRGLKSYDGMDVGPAQAVTK